MSHRPLILALLLPLLPLASAGCKGGGASAPASSQEDLALVRAAVKMNLDDLKAALDKGANPNATSDLLGKGPALVKLAREDPGFAKALLGKGANVNAAREDGDTPLIVAAIVGNAAVVKLLLDKGADVNARNVVGYTAASEAVHKGEAEVAQLLADKGADFTLGGGKDGQHLPFDRALGKSDRSRDVEKSRPAIVKLLLAKAKPDQKRLDMAAEAVSVWQKTGPNICAIAQALSAGGAEQTEAVKAFSVRCAGAPAAPPAPEGGTPAPKKTP